MPVFDPASDTVDVTLPEPGKYIVRCIDIEDAPDKGFGPGVKWIFELTDAHTGEVWQNDLWQFTSIKMGPKAKARPIIEALLGRPLEVREQPDARDLINRKMIAMVIHEPKEDGSQKAVVTSCKPFAEQPAVQAPQQARQQPRPAAQGQSSLRDQVKAAMRKAEILQTPKHLDWFSIPTENMTDADLYEFLQDINADIAAA